MIQILVAGDGIKLVTAVLRHLCHERPPVLDDQIFLAEGPTFQYTEPVTKDNLSWEITIFMADGVVFQDSFYCTTANVSLGP